MNDSILTSIKKLLGLTEAYEVFDADIIMHINTVFLTLKQVGVGPENGFMINDKYALWYEFIDIEAEPDKTTLLSTVKSYIYLKVKLLFDPPLNGSVMEANKQMIQELEWRLNIEAETE